MPEKYSTVNLDPRVGAGAAVWQVPNVAAIAAGGRHNLLLTTSGEVLASGSNERGQVDVPAGLSDVIAIAAGYAHSLALKRDGTVVAWGNNTRGATNVPVDLVDVVSISAGGGHSAAVRRDGTVVVWGELAVDIAGGPQGVTDAIAVASGWESCYALRSDGSVTAWGQTDIGPTSLPERLPPIASIAAGGEVIPHWVFITRDGTVEDGENTRRLESFGGVSQVVSVSVGGVHSLALRSDGTVLGAGTSPVRHTVPAGLNSVVAVAAGGDHSLALRSDGVVVAWGKNGYSQLVGPDGSIEEFAGWEDDGYYLQSLDTPRGPDPYAHSYGAAPRGVGKFDDGRDEATTALYQRGREYAERGEVDDAIEWLGRAADSGHVQAMRNLGSLYNQERGDDENAIRWFARAADAGDAASASIVGGLYEDQGNLHEALRWHTRAAEAGYIHAAGSLALLYLKQNDTDQAIRWFKEQVNVGGGALPVDESGTLYAVLGSLYLQKGDTAEATSWLRKALAGPLTEAERLEVLANLRAAAEMQGRAAPRSMPTPSSRTTSSVSKPQSGGCFIATAVYGSYDAPAVLVLRRYRDERLARSALGRGLIRFYYCVSPPLAKLFEDARVMNVPAKRLLDALVRRLDRQ